jgi:hypothetical protein
MSIVVNNPRRVRFLVGNTAPGEGWLGKKLESELCRQLNDSGRIRSLNLAEEIRIRCVHRGLEVGVVENIEKLKAQLEDLLLVDWE